MGDLIEKFKALKERWRREDLGLPPIELATPVIIVKMKPKAVKIKGKTAREKAKQALKAQVIEIIEYKASKKPTAPESVTQYSVRKTIGYSTQE